MEDELSPRHGLEQKPQVLSSNEKKKKGSRGASGPSPQETCAGSDRVRSTEKISEPRRRELGITQKGKGDGPVAAMGLLDGTNGTFVNESSHLKDQERVPAASDVKR